MVRFIICNRYSVQLGFLVFTFQYGQIYYNLFIFLKIILITIYIPIWLDLLSNSQENQWRYQQHLHSNMVRFIIIFPISMLAKVFLFTFQYGQIYYMVYSSWRSQFSCIYIPIWLDLLFPDNMVSLAFRPNLHSNMVRFIIYGVKCLEASMY